MNEPILLGRYKSLRQCRSQSSVRSLSVAYAPALTHCVRPWPPSVLDLQVQLPVPGRRKVKLGLTLSVFETDSLLPGVFVSHIHPGSIAASSKQLRVGDHILSVDGRPDAAPGFRSPSSLPLTLLCTWAWARCRPKCCDAVAERNAKVHRKVRRAPPFCHSWIPPSTHLPSHHDGPTSVQSVITRSLISTRVASN